MNPLTEFFLNKTGQRKFYIFRQRLVFFFKAQKNLLVLKNIENDADVPKWRDHNRYFLAHTGKLVVKQRRVFNMLQCESKAPCQIPFP